MQTGREWGGVTNRKVEVATIADGETESQTTCTREIDVALQISVLMLTAIALPLSTLNSPNG